LQNLLLEDQRLPFEVLQVYHMTLDLANPLFSTSLARLLGED
jgi:hypothetical protein